MQAAVRRLIHAVTATLSLWAAPAAAQDKPVHVIYTDPAPAAIEEGTYFQQTGLVAMAVRNRHTAPVFVTIRAWVFSENGRLRGTTTVCVAEPLERDTKRASSLSLDMPGLESSDAVAVAVVRAQDDRQRWDMIGVESDAVALARSRALGRGGRIRLAATPIERIAGDSLRVRDHGCRGGLQRAMRRYRAWRFHRRAHRLWRVLGRLLL